MILLVEDNEIQRLATVELLTQRGYRVRACANVPDALDQMLHQPPRVLLLDLVMSPVPGMSLLQLICERPQLQQVQVVITTALPSPLLDAPLLKDMPTRVEVLQKPFSSEELISVIERLAPQESKE